MNNQKIKNNELNQNKKTEKTFKNQLFETLKNSFEIKTDYNLEIDNNNQTKQEIQNNNEKAKNLKLNTIVTKEIIKKNENLNLNTKSIENLKIKLQQSTKNNKHIYTIYLKNITITLIKNLSKELNISQGHVIDLAFEMFLELLKNN